MSLLTHSLTALSLLSASAGFADQCQSVSRDDAIQAIKMLRLGQTVLEFCEPCGDVTYRPVTVKGFHVAPVGTSSYWGLYINGSIVDLAYTYVPSTSRDLNEYKVLSSFTSCEASDVSQTIHIGDGSW